MKNPSSLFLGSIIAFFFFVSCSGSGHTSFSAPQPDGAKDLSAFPRRMVGQYVSEDKSHSLFIAQNLIYRVFDYDITVHKNNLDSGDVIKGDTLISAGMSFKIKQIGDSIKTHYHAVDTVFALDKNNPIRKYKGYLFTNRYDGYGGWEVKKLSLNKGVLSIEGVNPIDSLKDIVEIKENNQDSSGTHKIDVTRKQFRIIMKDGFSAESKYYKTQSSARKSED